MPSSFDFSAKLYPISLCVFARFHGRNFNFTCLILSLISILLEIDQKIGGEMCWVMRRNFRIPSEEEMRRLVTPENVCVVFLVGREL